MATFFKVFCGLVAAYIFVLLVIGLAGVVTAACGALAGTTVICMGVFLVISAIIAYSEHDIYG